MPTSPSSKLFDNADIRIDWETYNPEEREDRLVDLLVIYGMPFPLRDAAGVEIDSKEEPTSDSPFVPSSSQSFTSLGSANPLEAVSVSVPREGAPGGMGACQDGNPESPSCVLRPWGQSRKNMSPCTPN